MVHDERRHQNCDLQVELDRQKNTIQERNSEIQRLKHELAQTVQSNQQLQS